MISFVGLGNLLLWKLISVFFVLMLILVMCVLIVWCLIWISLIRLVVGLGSGLK